VRFSSLMEHLRHRLASGASRRRDGGQNRHAHGQPTSSQDEEDIDLKPRLVPGSGRSSAVDRIRQRDTRERSG
jgi:hypothetical protein